MSTLHLTTNWSMTGNLEPLLKDPPERPIWFDDFIKKHISDDKNEHS